MSTPAKTSHHDNVDAFQKMLAFCVSLGTSYNPSPEALQLSNLQAVLAKATECLVALDAAIVATDDAATEREDAFLKLKKAITPLRNAINASDLPPLTIKDLLVHLNTIAGYGTPVEISKEEETKLIAEGKKPAKNKKIKTSFADRLAELNKMLARLESTQGYAPNEAHLSLKGLRTLYTSLEGAQKAAVDTKETEDRQRLKRNKCLYEDPGNMLDTGERTKKYLKSIYPSGNPEYQKIISFKFRDNKSRK